jgi:ornithine decarboxylase
MKSNPDINIIRTLHALGAGFDCASKQEIMDALSVGTPPSNIIYANPCKGPEHINFAKERKVDLMTFDSLAELQKIQTIHPGAKLVLRILPDDSKSIMPFGTKFGASFSDCKVLIERCRELNLDLVGVSFHVGSGCFSSSAFVDAVLLARKVFDLAEEVGFKPNLLDLGGGWPGVDTSNLSFVDIAKDLAPVLDQYFPPEVRIVAEPGRFFCTSCYTLAVSIISRRERWVKPKSDGENTEEPTKEILYYLSDGLYGSFNNIVFDHARPQPVPMKKDENTSRCSLFGPTCDSIDVVCKDIDLPELEIGDWLYFLNMGAYTLASASSFNGFKPPNAKYLLYTGDDSLSIS